MEAQKKTVQSKPNLGWSLLGLSFIPLIMVLGNSMLIPILPDMKNELDLSQFQTSLVITAFSIPAALTIPISGYLADHHGRKKVMIPALFVYASGGIIAGLGALFLQDNAYYVILAGRIIQGIGAAGTAPLAMTLASDIFNDETRSKALGVIEAFNGIGKVISPILGSLVAMIIWYATFFVFPLLCIPIAILVALTVMEPKGNLNKQPVSMYLKSITRTFSRKSVSLLSAFFAGSITLFILFGLLFFLSDMLESEYQIDGISKGLVLAIPLTIMAITSYATGKRVKSKLTKMKRITVKGMGVIALFSLFSVFTENIYYIVAWLSCIGLGTGMVLPCLNTLITSAVPAKERGLVTSLYGSVRFIGVAIGPPIFGFLMKISQQLMYGVMSGLAVLTVVIIHYYINTKQHTAKNS